MQDLNKLKLNKKRVDERLIRKLGKDIVEEKDTKDFVKLYLFKIICVTNYNSERNTFSMYLAPLSELCNGIVKVVDSIEFIPKNKVLTTLYKKNNLTPQEQYILEDKNMDIANKINKGKLEYYLLAYGYLTRKVDTSDVQTFAITKTFNKKIVISKEYSSYQYCDKNLEKMIKKYIACKHFIKSKTLLEKRYNELRDAIGFVEVPKEFIINEE